MDLDLSPQPMSLARFKDLVHCLRPLRCAACPSLARFMGRGVR